MHPALPAEPPPRSEVRVRQAVLADLDALAALLDQHRRLQGQPGDMPAARTFLLERFNHGESVLVIAGAGVADAAPMGFAQLYPSFSSTTLSRVFILNDLFVAESGRRLGVASKLLAAVEAYAWALSATRVTLNVGRSNAPGQALYRARGWKQDEQFYMFHRFPGGPGLPERS